MRIRRAYSIRSRSSRSHESGVAMIIALLTILIVSTLAAGLMFTTQSEIWTTANYRAVTEARYAAEAGVQRATYFLSSKWAAPASPLLSATATFNLADLPVSYYKSGSTSCAATPATNCVVLAPPSTTTSGIAAAIPGITDTYSTIDATMDTNFNAALNSTTSPFPGVSGSPNYTVAAQLLSASLTARRAGSRVGRSFRRDR
jgi:Tfp pilus assembly protein PilX